MSDGGGHIINIHFSLLTEGDFLICGMVIEQNYQRIKMRPRSLKMVNYFVM